MSSFDRLHPAVQHHIVNSLEWKNLRPLQEMAIDPLLGGKHAVLLAPTAGGKTEAAVFPLLSRMLTEDWKGLGLLYVCPLRALLNNLEIRLEKYAGLLGRRVGVWHGDIQGSRRYRIVVEPPDILLTTPESLEVMLVSRRLDHRELFRNVRAVVVDEIHAFAGDDRGWHLLAVLERIARLSHHSIQRIGLSATVGNPDELLEWLSFASSADRVVLSPKPEERSPPEVGLDYVGNLGNAAILISQLHRGEKRLVFCDSRSRVEQLGAALRDLGVETYLSHASLSRDDRKRAEGAFAEGQDCVTVATSTLELGIDVGDLDRVLQIDAPPNVASMLQRMGRTGRRPGTASNFLCLATSDSALLRAAGILTLWGEGFVEQIEPPPEPAHILAQQIMALALQESGIGVNDWMDWVGVMPGFVKMDMKYRQNLVRWMMERDILWGDSGMLWFGRKGEEIYGYRHFMELLSVITSPPRFVVMHGREELGTVDQTAVMLDRGGAQVVLLSGRTWQISHIDWKRKILHVRPAVQEGKPYWIGSFRPLHFKLCQAVKQVLAGRTDPPGLSARALTQLETARDEHSWLDPEATSVVFREAATPKWYTFGGWLANAALAQALRVTSGLAVTFDNFEISLQGASGQAQVTAAIEEVKKLPLEQIRPHVSEKAIEGLKFSECLPEAVAVELIERRSLDAAAVSFLLEQRVETVAID